MNNIAAVQSKILDIMRYIDKLCRENGIVYYVMGGTALGAVRHGGFIPWDDDLDIFMTPGNYKKFKRIFKKAGNRQFIIQEWRIVDEYLEYAKVRMNGTTFIERAFKHRKDMHHGIYVDIMILHKCPLNPIMQKMIYYESKYVKLVALSRRNWRPKTPAQKAVLFLLKFLPNDFISQKCYEQIYKYDHLKGNFKYCYYITKANFHQGLFEPDVFAAPVDIPFEDTWLWGPSNIREYLEQRFGDYLKLPPEQERKMAVHAQVYDTEVGFEAYL